METDWQIVPGERGRLYESARWIPSLGVFQWVDILAGSIHRWSVEHQEAGVESRSLGLEYVTVALPLDSFRSVVASQSSLYQYDWSTGILDELGRWHFSPDIRFNDGAISPDGIVHIGTMSMKGKKDAGKLYRFSGGELVPVLDGIGISNGLCWISETRAYYVDSVHPRIDTLTTVDGHVIRERWVDLDDGAEPDGLVVARDGTVYVANWGRGEVSQISAECVRKSLPTPVKFPTSIAFSGDERWMLVTSAAHGNALGEHDGHVLFTRCQEADDGVS
ncbi:SMP-30/gluconolactonase/LRE family protein [Mycolicibacterium pulveris]|uniref:SMP-30/gluconolactonase/LRE family protein n=1 Tax=Mycolicibacterium pulveris TaxID=36813 RepID=UPI003CFAA1AE